MIGTVLRLRVMLQLDPDKPLVFLAKAEDIYDGLNDNPTLFPSCTPTCPVLLGYLNDAKTAHANVGKIKGAAPVRTAKFRVLATALESERMMVQVLCDASPEQAASLIAAARMSSMAVNTHAKPLLAAKCIQPSGTVQLDANASLLDGTHRRKTFNWRMTLDGEKSFIQLPSTPTGQTIVSGLTLLTTVGFQVSVTVHKQPQGPWTATVPILVH